MKWLLKVEHLALLGLSIWMYSIAGWAWYWFAILFLFPDLGMLGYIAGNKAGAIAYDLAHHQAICIGLFVTGLYASQDSLVALGAIALGHSAFDRMLGYGLKYFTGFRYTHLGTIGRAASQK